MRLTLSGGLRAALRAGGGAQGTRRARRSPGARGGNKFHSVTEKEGVRTLRGSFTAVYQYAVLKTQYVTQSGTSSHTGRGGTTTTSTRYLVYGTIGFSTDDGVLVS